MVMNPELRALLIAFAVGYLPGAILGIGFWCWGRRSAAMPLFQADLISFAVPIVIWLVMHRYNWTFAVVPHRAADELAILGWIWSVCVICRMLIPQITHKLRFRLAAIHTGSVCTVAAVLLALFYQVCWK